MLRIVVSSLVLYLACPGGTHAAPNIQALNDPLPGGLEGEEALLTLGEDIEWTPQPLGLVKRADIPWCVVDFEDDVFPEKRPLGGEDGKLGSGKAQGQKKPLPPGEDVMASPKKAQAVERAKTVSLQEFEKSAAERRLKVPKVWADKGIATFTEARQRIGYKPLEAPLPHLVPQSGAKAHGALGKAGGAVAGALFVGGIVASFVTNTTALDKAAALTAVIPFVGCLVNSAAAVENGEDTTLVTIDAMLCSVADILLFGPLAPLGVVLHFYRVVLSFYRAPPKPPTLEQMREQRDESWAETLRRVYASVYSHSYSDPTQSFAAKLQSALTIDSVSVLSSAADTIGTLNATGSPDLVDASSDPNVDLEELEAGTREAISKIRQVRWHVVARRQRDFLLDIPQRFANGTLFSLLKLSGEVNEAFIARINSDSFIDNYRDQNGIDDMSDAIFAGPFYDDFDPFSKARAQMQEVGLRLRESLPPMPKALDVAFILGQSKGMDSLQPETLSPMSYFNMEISEASAEPLPPLYCLRALLRHTNQVVLFIQGRLKEDEFDNSIFPVDNLDLLKRLRLLIAMKLGRLYEEEKLKMLDHSNGYYYLSPSAPPEVINPYIPPISQHPNNSLLISLALGLINTVSDDSFGAEVTHYLQNQTSQIRLKNWQAMQKKIKAIKGAVVKISARLHTGPSTPEEFLTKHVPTCVQLGSSEQDCKLFVRGCYYPDDPSDEFASGCIHDVLKPIDQVRVEVETKRRELCDKFPSLRQCNRAMSKCARTIPKAGIHVIFACAAKAIPKADVVASAAAGAATSTS